MNKKIKFSSLLKNASNLTDIFDFYKKIFLQKNFYFLRSKTHGVAKLFKKSE